MSRISVLLMVVVAACTTAVHGGFKTVNVPDEGVAKAAEQAARALNKDSDHWFHKKLVKVVKAQSQPGDIEGEIYYKLDLIMGLTTCEKKKVQTYDDAKGCDIQKVWGLDVKGVGIHQRQPGYLPTYNGIFSIHALNYTDVPPPYAQQQVVTNNASRLPTEGQPDNDLPENQEINFFSEDGTAVNEVDFEQKIPISDLTTFPQLQVMTQTIGDVTEDRDDERTADTDQGTIQNDTTTEQIRTDSESLQEGSEGNEEDSNQNTQKPESEDLFDRLMRTIQGHWLEFVGKMKMSVLDVWKSISHSMMERLETFATDV